MEVATKVIVAADAMFQNGTLLGKVGTALTAHVLFRLNLGSIGCSLF